MGNFLKFLTTKSKPRTLPLTISHLLTFDGWKSLGENLRAILDTWIDLRHWVHLVWLLVNGNCMTSGLLIWWKVFWTSWLWISGGKPLEHQSGAWFVGNSSSVGMNKFGQVGNTWFENSWKLIEEDSLMMFEGCKFRFKECCAHVGLVVKKSVRKEKYLITIRSYNLVILRRHPLQLTTQILLNCSPLATHLIRTSSSNTNSQKKAIHSANLYPEVLRGLRWSWWKCWTTRMHKTVGYYAISQLTLAFRNAFSRLDTPISQFVVECRHANFVTRTLN